MKTLKLGLLPTLLLICLTANAAGERPPLFPKIQFETNAGDFIVQLDGRRAPLTVANFVKLVNSGHYNGTIFHRVIPGFMAQGGGFDSALSEKPTMKTVPNESGNGLSNRRGTIAMARTGDPHSATAQFFINLVDNGRLDPSPQRWGYTVFGEVFDENPNDDVDPMAVLDAIAAIETGPKGRFRSDVPKTEVLIKTVTVMGSKAKGAPSK
ncbi:MAG: peptidylprolyl isomerase [Gammaproteobacteria bacterium]